MKNILSELQMLRNTLYLYNHGLRGQQEEAGKWLHSFYVKYGTVDPVAFQELTR